MTNPYGVSDAEFNIIKQQAARRATLRQEFNKQKTNPFKHANEAGYVVSINYVILLWIDRIFENVGYYSK